MIKYVVLICCIVLLGATAACDPQSCYHHQFRNSSGQQVSIHHYRFGEVDYSFSFDQLPPGSIYKIEGSCSRGKSGPYPIYVYMSPLPTDSIVVVFDDTIRGLVFKESLAWSQENEHIFLFGAKNFALHQDAWTLISTDEPRSWAIAYYFEYEFTDWHYQQALETHLRGR